MNSENPTLRIAIQKSGRLSEQTIDLLKSIGLKFHSFHNKMLVQAKNFDVELLLIRDDDIPEYVQDGVCELGFVGANVTQERGANVSVIRNLDYGICRLSLAVPKDSNFNTAADLNGKRIATSYPNLTKKYFAEKDLHVETVYINGAVEVTPALNVADAITDLVSTGGTLKANGMIEMEEILSSECQLIQTNKPITPMKQELIRKFLTRMEGSQQAERSRYIVMNAPKTSLDEICQIIPSLKSPTVLPLADDNQVAIHSVIPIDRFWEVMEELKAAGATGIVILPIENMIV